MQNYQDWHEEFEKILREDFSHLTMDSLSPGLLTLVQPQRKDKLLPLIVDQTTIGDAQGDYRKLPDSRKSNSYEYD